MNRQVGFTRKILEILEDYNISFDHMPSVLIVLVSSFEHIN